MGNNELNLITEEMEFEKPKFHYEPTFEATEQIPIYDQDGNQTGTETHVTGRILKKVWTDEEELKNILRAKRNSLLNAFDKWEKAVLRGRKEDKEYIMSWYYDLLDLKEYAFKNVPEEIKYYL